MLLDFEKWHGCRNDFVVVRLDRTDTTTRQSLERQAKRICSRMGDGIAADGILVLERESSRVLPSRLIIINSDGSLAKTCGNGIRCAALSILREINAKQNDLPEGIELALDDDKVLCRFHGKPSSLSATDHGNWPFVEVAMGKAKVDAECAWYADAKAEVKRISDLFPHLKLANDWSAVDVGNRHLVFFLENANQETIRLVGPAFQTSSFWDGINVHLAQEKPLSGGDQQKFTKKLGGAIDASLEVFVWERGAGETQACGSGACAVIASLLRKGWHQRDAWHSILMPGGYLFIKQQEAGDMIHLCGPGELTFTGSFVL